MAALVALMLCAVMARPIIAAESPVRPNVAANRFEAFQRVRIGPWMRNYQRDHADVKAAFRDVVAGAGKSTVLVLCDNRQAALGAVTSADGHLVTKASQLKGKIACKMKDGRTLPATIVGIDRKHDLAMLRVAAKNLTPVRWSSRRVPQVGSLLVTPGMSRDPVAIGVLSVSPRKVPSPPGVMGVVLDQIKAGPRINRIFPNSGAARAGLKTDDVIVELNGRRTPTREALVGLLKSFHPGEVVRVRVRRGTEDLALTVLLGERPKEGPGARHREYQNRMGGELSRRRTGFPTVFQHDTFLRPTHCGGPIVDLDGAVVGINIARAGRVASYALPASAVQALLGDLKSGKLAPSSPPKMTRQEKLAAAQKRIAEAKVALRRAEAAKLTSGRQVEQAQTYLKKTLLVKAAAELKKIEADEDPAQRAKAQAAFSAAEAAIQQAEAKLRQVEGNDDNAKQAMVRARAELEKAQAEKARLEGKP